MASGRDSARRLAAEYFRQLGETGETEIYLPVGETTTPSRASSPGDTATAPGATATASPSGVSPEVGAATATAPEPESPAPEIIHVKFAFSTGSTTGDMFSGTAGLESCTTLDAVEAASAGCEKCELSGGRTKIVFGVGNPGARLMFIGEAPGRDEDIQGIPFVGRAGQLLNKILDAAEIAREDVYIANIIKCRPPNNRTPLTNEIES